MLQSDLRRDGLSPTAASRSQITADRIAPQAGGAAVDLVNDNQGWLVPKGGRDVHHPVRRWLDYQ